MKIRHLRRPLLLALACLLSLLVLTEATLRLSQSSLPLLLRLHIRAHPRFSSSAHPYIGHLNRAVSNTDPLGFRNEWPWPDAPRILTLGDSVTFGNGVGDREGWAAILARAFPEDGVVNLGLGASGPQQYLRVFETFGAGLGPKVVLIGLFARNDFWDAAKFEDWLQSRAGGNYLVWRDSGSPAHVSLSLRQPPERLLRSAAWRGRVVAGGTYLGNLLLQISGRLGRHTSSGHDVYESQDGTQLELQSEDFLSATKRSRPGTAAFRHVLLTLQRIDSLARENGAKAVVLLLPSKEEVYLPLLGETTPDPAAPLHSALEAVGIPSLDLQQDFRRRAVGGEVLFHGKESQLPNARGHALIAELAIRYLRQHLDWFGLSRPTGVIDGQQALRH